MTRRSTAKRMSGRKGVEGRLARGRRRRREVCMEQGARMKEVKGGLQGERELEKEEY